MPYSRLDEPYATPPEIRSSSNKFSKRGFLTGMGSALSIATIWGLLDPSGLAVLLYWPTFGLASVFPPAAVLGFLALSLLSLYAANQAPPGHSLPDAVGGWLIGFVTTALILGTLFITVVIASTG